MDDIRNIIPEFQYKWDSKVEKEIQEAINHWLLCYDGVWVYNFEEQYIPANIKCDLWRDILTSIFDIHNRMIVDKLNKIYSRSKTSVSKKPTLDKSKGT